MQQSHHRAFLARAEAGLTTVELRNAREPWQICGTVFAVSRSSAIVFQGALSDGAWNLSDPSALTSAKVPLRGHRSDLTWLCVGRAANSACSQGNRGGAEAPPCFVQSRGSRAAAFEAIMATPVLLLHEALYRIVRSRDSVSERAQRAERVILHYVGACGRAAALDPHQPGTSRSEVDGAMNQLENVLQAWKRLGCEAGLVCDRVLDVVLRQRLEIASDRRIEDAVPASRARQGGTSPVLWGQGA
jgi:hypothetical protein